MIEEVQIGDIGEQIRHAIGYHEAFRISIGNFTLPFSETIVGTWISMVVIFALAIFMGRGFEEIPRRKQVVTEGIVEIFTGLCKSNSMDERQTQIVAPFVGSIAIFICITNLTSMFKMVPPSKDPVFPVVLALFTILYVIVTGIRLVGIKGFWKYLLYPKAALVPFKILDFFIKPVSLSLRLFGNIFGAFILMEFVYIIMPALIPGIIGIWFDLADGILQAAVFSYLSIVYIGEIVEGANHAAGVEMKARSGAKAQVKA